MVAREATDEELERLGPRLVELHPDYDVYPGPPISEDPGRHPEPCGLKSPKAI